MRPFQITTELSVTSTIQVAELICRYPEIMCELFSDNSFRQWLTGLDAELGESAIQVFSREDDPQLGLFKASYILAPGHPLIFMGEEYRDLKDLGAKILLSAPVPPQAPLWFLTSGALMHYVEIIRLSERQPGLYAQIKALTALAATEPQIVLFRLGYLLSGDTRFHFQGAAYPTITDFFLARGGDNQLMSSFDFLTAPYSIAYHQAVGSGRNLTRAQALAHADSEAQKRLDTFLHRR